MSKQSHITTIMDGIEEKLYMAKQSAIEGIKNAAELLIGADTKKTIFLDGEVPYVIKIEYNGETYDIYYNWDLNQELDLVEIEDIVQKLNNGKYEIKTLK